MSTQALILNYILKRYVKSVRPSVENSSYTDARKMMNQKGYEDKNQNFISKLLLNKIFDLPKF